ncbi:MAG: type I pullulanase [Bacteroidales bacterium]|nr:type I pullulanase [Bacteroidales bacterium]
MKKLLFIVLAIGLLASCNQSSKKIQSFEEYPVYNGDDLELTYSSHNSKFRVWSPTADEVKLLLFNSGSEGSAYEMKDMRRSKNGTWVANVKGDLKGKFYTFQVKMGEQWLDETPGMWVKAVGINGKRAAIIDMAETNPEGWENDKHVLPENVTDAVIYEVHMRDFSISPTSGIKNKGKFLAFTEKGTKNTAGQATGIDHLKELGVTHVHLLPSYDFASIDEAKLDENKYNWGYDPQNYNVPEGSYSTDPENPVSRIKEFKQMVQSLHNEGIGVIMDVVYNHTYVGENSHLNLLVPGYFYRFNADSTWSNASGCGNETASERAMMRKFIVESVVHWAKEYHVDGFRFDLMGIHDIETMNAIRAALDKVDPRIIIYGEGWTAAASPLDEEKRALKKNVSQLNGIAVFSDDIRDVLKGNWTNEFPGFVAGRDSLENAVKFSVAASTVFPDVTNERLVHTDKPYATSPTQIINYVSCHDDMCLVDALRKRRPGGATEAEIQKFNKLAQTIVFTSQGVPFVFAGEEVYRDKKGVNNTYESPDSINQINWNNKTTYNDIFTYYQGLIALRKAHPAFRMTSLEMMKKHLKFIELGVRNVVAFTLSDNANGDSWKEILVIYNGNRRNVSVELPEGEWSVVCHDGKISPATSLFTISGPRFIVGASSASVMFGSGDTPK